MLKRTVKEFDGVNRLPRYVVVGGDFNVGEEVVVLSPAELEAQLEAARWHESLVGKNLLRRIKDLKAELAEAREEGGAMSMEFFTDSLGFTCRQEEILRFSPEGFAAKLEEARAEVPEGFDAAAVERVRTKIAGVTKIWTCFGCGAEEDAEYWCGCPHSDRFGRDWCRDHGVESRCYGPTLLAAAQAFLAAVEAAAKPEPCPPEPCPHKGAKWDADKCAWRWVDPDKPMTHINSPGSHCVLCGEPLPPKPVEHTSDDELEAEAKDRIYYSGCCGDMQPRAERHEVRITDQRNVPSVWLYGASRREVMEKVVTRLREEQIAP